MRACLSGFVLWCAVSPVGFFSPQAKGEEVAAEDTEQAKQEIQKYIKLVGQNDLENRESAYEETRESQKKPGWKSR